MFVLCLWFCQGQGSPVLSLLQDLHRVQTAGLLNRRDAVLLLVQRHHGGGLRRMGQVSRRLGLRRHDRRRGGRHRRWCGRGTSGGLRRHQLLRSVGGSRRVDQRTCHTDTHHHRLLHLKMFSHCSLHGCALTFRPWFRRPVVVLALNTSRDSRRSRRRHVGSHHPCGATGTN